MTINIATETLLSLTAAAKELPRLRQDRPVNPSTVWRWHRFGIRGVKLETLVVGGRRATSIEALQRFLQAINSPPANADAPKAETAPDLDQEPA